ncbi:hypothetical protein NHX12_004713, partial [Muraenolepis orangiensis]
KRDSLSPLEEDDVRENIITYDDEGGGEADTAAFVIAALQSAPHSSRTRGYHTLDSRNVKHRATNETAVGKMAGTVVAAEAPVLFALYTEGCLGATARRVSKFCKQPHLARTAVGIWHPHTHANTFPSFPRDCSCSTSQ